MFIRFVIGEIDSDSGRRQGLFQAAEKLRDRDTLTKQEIADVERLQSWFRQNLNKPKRLSLSRRPHSKTQAISWFKSSAVEHIARMQELAAIMERHGLDVHMIKARRPGYVLYEDEFQVAAYPFRETRT